MARIHYFFLLTLVQVQLVSVLCDVNVLKLIHHPIVAHPPVYLGLALSQFLHAVTACMASNVHLYSVTSCLAINRFKNVGIIANLQKKELESLVEKCFVPVFFLDIKRFRTKVDSRVD